MNTNKLQEYANFYAYYLGTIHAKSADSKFIDNILANEDLILKTAKHIAKIFKNTVKE